MAQPKLTMALSHYDRHIPFFDGSVKPEGLDLTIFEVGQSEPLKHGQDRHERMLQKAEFDICELSLSSYLMAKSRAMPFTAIPAFQSVADVGECGRENSLAAGSDWEKSWAKHISNDALGASQGRFAIRIRRSLAQVELGGIEGGSHTVQTTGRSPHRDRFRRKENRDDVGAGRDRRVNGATSAKGGVAGFQENSALVRRPQAGRDSILSEKRILSDH